MYILQDYVIALSCGDHISFKACKATMYILQDYFIALSCADHISFKACKATMYILQDYVSSYKSQLISLNFHPLTYWMEIQVLN